MTGPADLTVTQELPWKMLNYVVGPANFLKHEDRDPLETLDEEYFDPAGVIGHALTACSFVRPNKPLPDKIKPYLECHGLLQELR